jgi:hypothetical protein
MVAQFVGALHYKLKVHRFGFLMVPLEFSINIILPVALWLTQPPTEMGTRNSSWG